MLTENAGVYERYEQGIEDGRNHQGPPPTVTTVMRRSDPWYWQGFQEASNHTTAGEITPAAVFCAAA